MMENKKTDLYGPTHLSEGFVDSPHLLAHRYPFLLVDRIRVITSGEEGIGVKNVTSTEDVLALGLEGDDRRLPATLVVEALAQTSAAVMGRLMLDEGHPGVSEGFLVRVGEFTFMREGPAPGDVMFMHVKLIFRRGKFFRFSTRAEINGETTAKGDLTFALK
ncbi:MAG: beta-hydroxyacyl-ACP dehydratase [Deltaproteobacteria bacterium]|nr:beta-hydroxyacyl-ACP dehydratase [Deltaproteobacteria bacterium]MBW2308859.1 beta-hydroxyacyl-ACP dehydratase [Deltaproteobacteria bacterium]